MSESQTNSVAEFDAAVDAQRSARLASLQRKAARASYLVWIVLGFLALDVVLMAGAYFFDRRVSPLAQIVILLGAFSSVVAAEAGRRRRAAEELRNELRSQSAPRDF